MEHDPDMDRSTEIWSRWEDNRKAVEPDARARVRTRTKNVVFRITDPERSGKGMNE